MYHSRFQPAGYGPAHSIFMTGLWAVQNTKSAETCDVPFGLEMTNLAKSELFLIPDFFKSVVVAAVRTEEPNRSAA